MKMKIGYWNYLIFSIIQLQNTLAENWMKFLTKQTFDNSNFYQVSIFTNHDLDIFTKYENQLIAEISQKVPLIVINLENFQNNDGNSTFNLLFTDYSKLFVILARDNYRQIRNNLNVISNMLPVAPRPKCTLIIFQRNKSLSSNDEVKKTLLNAWKLKYLDFTVIKKTPANRIEMVLFNPFLNHYHKENFNSKSVVFPDKMKNMHQFRLNAPLFDFQPFSIIEGNFKEGFKPKSSGIFHYYHRYALIQLNCSVNYIIVNYTTALDLRSKLFHLLKNNSIFFSAFPLIYEMKQKIPYKLLLGNELLYAPLIFVVPARNKKNAFNTADFLPFICVFIFILILRFIIVKLMKFPLEIWNLFNIYKFFMERNDLRNIKKLAQKIIYLCMAVVSINLSANWLATATLKLLDKQNEFTSFDDIVKMNLSIKSTSIYFINVFNENQNKLGNPFSKKATILKGVDDTINCIDDVLKNQDVSCLITPGYLNYCIKMKFKKKYEIPALKILYSTIFSNYWNYVFEEASPYVEKINSIVLKFKESGIDNLELESELAKTENHDKRLAISNDPFLVTKLLIVLVTGHSISLCILILEILFGKLKKRLN